MVLGGSRGIGAATVKRLVAEGAKVTFTYASSEETAQSLAEETGSNAVKVDSAERDALTKVIESQDSIDILVVSAGTFVMGHALEVDPDDIDRMIDINVRSPYHAAVAAAKQMPKGGRIVIIGSVNGDRMPMAGAAGYALTKSAIQGW